MDVDMFVNKRNGSREPVAFDKILTRLKTIATQYNLKINCTSLAMKVIDQLYNDISTTKIDELSAEQCAALSSSHPDYNVMAGVISMSSHQKNTNPSFYETMSELYHFHDKNSLHHSLICENLYAFT